MSFAPTTYTVREGVDEYADLMLARSGDLTRNTTVTVIIFDGSAKGMLYKALSVLHYELHGFYLFVADADSYSIKREQTFAPGDNKTVVRIKIVDDNEKESDEIFIAVVSTSEPNVVVDGTPSTVTIVDLDGEICFFRLMNVLFSLFIYSFMSQSQQTNKW